MSKRWFTPSFEPSASAAPASASAPTTTTTTTTTETRRSKNARPITDQRKTRRCGGGGVGGSGRPANVATNNDRGVVDVLSKYEPETPDDLVIHVKKVEQVRVWIESRISHRRAGASPTTAAADGKYLLLHGPSGCGKSTTLRVLAKSLNVQIIEWITPLDREQRYRDDDDDGGGDDDADDYDSRRYFGGRGAADVFDSFLWRASRYSSLGASTVVYKRRRRHHHDQQQQQQQPPVLKIILVKDFPHSLAQNAQSFHDILRKYRAYDTYPMSFVCNDDALCRSLFPEQIRGECGVHDIAFNAVNCTAVTKALKRLLEMERRLNPALVTVSPPNQLCLQSFHQQSAGDLRCALLKFYFSIVKPTPTPSLSTSSSSSSSKVKRTDDYAAAAAAAAATAVTDTADHHGSSDLFKVIGRVLYCKREPLDDAGCAGGDYKFVYDPDQLAKSMTDQPCFFTGFLRENYVSRFQDVASVASAADTFCVVDVLFKRRSTEAGAGAAAAATGDALALSCLVRRLMVSNRQPRKSFAPFVKPKTCDSADTFAARLSRSVRSAFPHFQFPASELVMHVLPFARAIPSLNDELGPHLRQVSGTGTGIATAFSLTTAR